MTKETVPRNEGYQASLELHHQIEALYPRVEQHSAYFRVLMPVDPALLRAPGKTGGVRLDPIVCALAIKAATTKREQRAATWRATLRGEPKVARMLLRRLIGPLEMWDPAVPSAEWTDWESSLTPALLEGLAPIHVVASPRGCARVGAPETVIQGAVAA